jgi:hypothetical protein
MIFEIETISNKKISTTKLQILLSYTILGCLGPRSYEKLMIFFRRTISRMGELYNFGIKIVIVRGHMKKIIFFSGNHF